MATTDHRLAKTHTKIIENLNSTITELKAQLDECKKYKTRYYFMRKNIDYEYDKKDKNGYYFYNHRGEFNFEAESYSDRPSFEYVLGSAIEREKNHE